MRKRKSNNLLKLGILFFGTSLLLFNCEKEENMSFSYPTETYKPTINYLTGKDIPKLIYQIASKTGGKVAAKSYSESVSIQTNFGTITFDNVIQVIDSIGNTNYTFKITPNVYNDKVFYNLVLNTKYEDPYIYEYIMDENFYKAYKNKSVNIDQFAGSIKRHKINSLKTSYKNLAKGGVETCPNVIIIENNNPAGGSGEPGGGAGTGVSGTPVGNNNSGGSISGGGEGLSYPTVPCRLVVEYNLCNSGGGGGHPPACQHSGGIHDQPGNEEICDHQCTGSTFKTAYLAGDCGVDDSSDTHNNNKNSNSDCPSFGGEIAIIIPEGVEPLLTKLRIELSLNLEQNSWLRAKPDIGVDLYYFLESNVWSIEAKKFVKDALSFLIDNTQYDFNYLLNNRSELDQNIKNDYNNNTIGGYDTSVYNDFDSINQSWPIVSPVISQNNFVGWNRGLHPNWGCMDYSKAQIAKKGYKISNYFNPLGKSWDQTIQVFTDKKGINREELNRGLSYLTYALKKGIPVVVGIDNHTGSPNPDTDNTTDHFVVIVGMGSDSKGKYFTFYDNASGITAQGTHRDNKLYYNSTTGKITGTSQTTYAQGVGLYDYTLTMIRKSK